MKGIESLTFEDLLKLYDEMSDTIFNLNCSDFEGCEDAIIRGHELAAKLMTIIKENRSAT